MSTQPVSHRQGVAAIDPLGPTTGGWYVDELVQVRSVGASRARPVGGVHTPHFDVRMVGDRMHVDHVVPPAQIDDDVAGLLADELFAPGWLRGTELFERIFTGVVRSSVADPLESWLLFYRNSLVRIEQALLVRNRAEPGSATQGGHGTIDDYAPVYRHVESLLAPGSVIELGSCFGFLSLRLAAHERRVTASDVSAGTMRLLASVAPLLGVRLRTVVADAARYPAPHDAADNVLAIHLLEHLDEAHGERTIAEAIRLARQRVVVAVPLEAEAEETWGHVRTVSLEDLDGWGRASGLPYEVHEHHGGWLVIETGG